MTRFGNLAAAILALSIGWSGVVEAQAKPLNVLYIMLDDNAEPLHPGRTDAPLKTPLKTNPYQQ
jgi:hypothetical protein